MLQPFIPGRQVINLWDFTGRLALCCSVDTNVVDGGFFFFPWGIALLNSGEKDVEENLLPEGDHCP